MKLEWVRKLEEEKHQKKVERRPKEKTVRKGKKG